MPTTKDLSLFALLLVALVALALAGLIDAQEADSSRQLYCEMVAQWDKDAALGIAPEQRTGWPPYDGRKQCEEGARK